MPNNIDIPNPTEKKETIAELESRLSQPVKEPVKKTKIKPLVEGINAPKTTTDVIMVKPSLTQQEKELIADVQSEPQPAKEAPVIMSQNFSLPVSKDRGGLKWLIAIVLVLFVLVLAGYEFYLWKLDSAKQPAIMHKPKLELQTAPDVLSAAGSQAASSTASSSPSAASSIVPSAAASTTPPSQPATQLVVKSTPTGYLNVRTSPSTSAKSIKQIHPGEVYTYTEIQNGWYKISLPNNLSGWVSGQYVTVQK